MEFIGYIWDWVIPFLVVFTILVFVHEMGHYWVARLNKVRIEVFSIGFGPELYGWHDRHGTRWKLSAVPLGGYVKMFGESQEGTDDTEPARPMSPADQAASFHHKRLGQRAAIVAAGPAANFVFAIVLFAGMFAIAGIPMPHAAVGDVQPDSAAAEAGLESGDRILSVDGEPVRWFDDLRAEVSGRPDTALTLEVARDGETLRITATPKPTEVRIDGESQVIGLLGITPDPTQVGFDRLNPLAAVWTASERTVVMVGQILGAVWQMITGQRTAEELGGPLRIAQLSGEMAQGGVVTLVFFMAVLSINLGLINLFPVPMLDGGHLAFYAVEAVRGKPLDQKVQEYGFRLGLVLVLMLLVFVTWNDLVQLEVVEMVRRLVS